MGEGKGLRGYVKIEREIERGRRLKMKRIKENRV